jgi:enoyl-CoA hydratase
MNASPEAFGAEADIAFNRVGSAVDVRLIRPQALNALTHAMALALYSGLCAWRHDPSVSHVVISGEVGEKRAFCAGGDLRDLYQGGQENRPRHDFFRDEYRLNAAIAAFPKPYVALMDGYVMGGGAGIAIHGSHRVAGTNTRFSMPEAAIGLVPDVGSTHVLPRLPHRVGWLLGLCGIAINGADCLASGIATHHCADHQALRRALLASAGDVENVLARNAETPPASPLQARFSEVAQIFAPGPLSAMQDRLEHAAKTDAFFADAAKRFRRACPLSLALAHRMLALGGQRPLADCLATEYDVVSHILRGPNLYEGIRATLIDRSRPAEWKPDSLDGLDEALILAHFQEGAEPRLILPD